jgi:ubiquinone/menaquinone biosynthesis C-methylase UbiE
VEKDERMHPIFQRIFTAPTDCKPLRYEGTTERGRWKDGILRIVDNGTSFPVHDSIPNFVPSSVETWSEDNIEEIRKGDWIRRNWESQVAEAQTTSKRAAFFKLMAETDSIILDVASGPGGGNMPGTVYYNPETKFLMSDLGARVLHEWQNYLRNNGLGGNVCFAAFDATKMPIRSESFDTVTSRGGFSNIPEPDKAIKEAHRVLKRSGTLLISEGKITQDSLSQLPEKVQSEWKKMFPQLGRSYEEILTNSGFSIANFSEAQKQALKPDEAELPRLAAEHGVTLYFVDCHIHASKR